MKRLFLILLLFPTICFSQSSTDCPTWDSKGKPKNKADYYRSLRPTKPIKANDSNKLNSTKPKAETKKVTITKPATEKTEIKKDTAKSEAKEKEEKEKKTKRLPPRKTTKVRKKKTTGCPQF